MRIIIENIPKEDRPFFKRLLRDFSKLHFVTSGKNNLYAVYDEPYNITENDLIEKNRTKTAIYNAILKLREFQANK